MAQIVGFALLNLALIVGLAPLAEGISRRVLAIVHSRKGPPLIQPYLDILKLLGKEDLQTTKNFVWKIAPALCLGATLTAALFIPFGTPAPLSGSGDVIAFLYLIILSSVAVMLNGFACANPYAYLGSSREMMMIFSIEPILTIALVTAALKTQSLRFADIIASNEATGITVSMTIAGIAVLLALQAQAGKIPFDIAEADQEIMEGPLIERSGPGLALFRLASWVRFIIFASILFQVFFSWCLFGNWGIRLLLNLVGIAVILLIVSLINAVNPRLRIDQSMSYFARVVVFVAFGGLIFAAIGV